MKLRTTEQNKTTTTWKTCFLFFFQSNSFNSFNERSRFNSNIRFTLHPCLQLVCQHLRDIRGFVFNFNVVANKVSLGLKKKNYLLKTAICW